MVSIVVAKALNNVIGKSNDLPWYLPADLKHFKQLTLGHPVIMGSKTFRSIVERIGNPLPGRLNIVLTRQPKVDGAIVTDSVKKAIQIATQHDNQIFVLGGASVYKQALDDNLIDAIYLTEVKASIDGDVYFPDLPAGIWHEVSRQDFRADDKNRYDYSFVTLKRR